MYICVDFDGTIVDHVFPKIGTLVPGAIECLKELQDKGHKIILFTMRSDGEQLGDVLSEAVKFLKENGIALYGINKNPDQSSWTSSPKAYGHIYIDDCAIGCPMIHPKGFNRPCVDWPIVSKLIKNMKTIEVF